MKKDTLGITLVECMLCLLIALLISGTAAPALKALIENNQRAQSTNQMTSAIHFARSTAVLDRVTVTICAGIGACAGQSSWHDSLLTFSDINANGRLDQGETVLRIDALAQGYSWRWAGFRQNGFLQFEPDGTTRAQNGTLTLCRELQPLNQIIISLSGRARGQRPARHASC